MKTRGFTLIELMIVSAILGILAAIAIPKFADMVIKSKEAALLGQLGALRSAVSIYYSNTEGIEFSTTSFLAPGGVSGALTGGGYIDEIPYMTIPRHKGTMINPASVYAGAANYQRGLPHVGNGISPDFMAVGFTICEMCAINQKMPWILNLRSGSIDVNCDHFNSRGNPWSTY